LYTQAAQPINPTVASLGTIFDSAPSLGVYYFLSLTLYVCHAPSNRFFFLFLDGIKPFLGRQFSVWHSTKRCSSIFDLGPLTPKILAKKSPITRLVWQIERRCLHLLGGFRGWPIQWNHTKCCGPTLVAMATKFGIKSPITRLVPSNRFFFFVSRWNRAICWPSVLHVALYKTLLFDF